MAFFKTQITRLKPKIVFYLNYKHFEDSRFLEDLHSTEFSLETDDPNKNYNFTTEKFLDVVNKHEPPKEKTLRGNQAPFMTKELRNEIYTRSKLKNKYNRNPSEECKATYKKDKMLTEEEELKIFNDHYINIVERSRGTKPTILPKEQENEDNKKAVEEISKSFANHESIKAIQRK